MASQFCEFAKMSKHLTKKPLNEAEINTLT